MFCRHTGVSKCIYRHTLFTWLAQTFDPVCFFDLVAVMLLFCFNTCLITSSSELNPTRGYLLFICRSRWISVADLLLHLQTAAGMKWHQAPVHVPEKQMSQGWPWLTPARDPNRRERSRNTYECQDLKFCVHANLSPIQSLFHCIGRI